MLHSDNFQTTTFEFNGGSYPMEYNLKITNKSYVGFGNIYIEGKDEEPTEFTFFTLNDRVAGYTPMNGKKEYIAAIVETITGKKMPVDDAF